MGGLEVNHQGGAGTPPVPTRDRKYLTFLKTQACAVCHHSGNPWNQIEPAHTGNRGRATSQKADDYDAISLCRRCHWEGAFSYHQHRHESDWVERHNIDLPSLRTMNLARYRAAEEAEA